MIIKKLNKNNQGCIQIGALGLCVTAGVSVKKDGINLRV